MSESPPALSGPLAGRYRLDSWLGGGAMGDVYAAEDLTTGERVAVKLMSERHRGRPDALERFRREARAARRIGHEGVVAILDFGAGPDGPPFLVMELLRGESLDGTLDREVRLPWPVVRSLGAQLADALQAAHDLGVIHRDLKPSNCFVVDGADGPRVKILDFGLAKLNTTDYDARLELTSTGVTLGTLRYMAPEQARDPARVDARADLYSLGVILFRMLTGAAPIRGANELHFLNNLLNGEPRRLAEAAPDLAWPAELERFFARALAKLPDDRFADAQGLAAALLAIAPDRVPFVRPAAVIPIDADEPPEVDAFDATERAASPHPRVAADPARLVALACEQVAARAGVYVDHRAAWDADEFALPGGIRLIIARGDPVLADEAALLCPVQESGAGPRSFVRRVCEFGGPALVADVHAQRALLSGQVYPIRAGRLAAARVLLAVLPDEAIGLLRIRELCARFAAQSIGHAERQGLASLATPAMFQGALGGGRQAGIVAFVAAFGRALLSVPCESLRAIRLIVSDSGEALVRTGGELTLDLSAVTSSPLERTQRFVLGRYPTMRALGDALASAIPPGARRELHLVQGARTLTPAHFLDDLTSPAAAGLKHGSRLVLVAP